jgi:hypothetical protein
MHRIKGTDHVLGLPEGSKLLVKDRFWQIQLTWIDVWCRLRAAFSVACYRLTLTVESKSRDAASASKSMRAVAKNEARKKVKKSDSKGVVFSLDFRGHIEVVCR